MTVEVALARATPVTAGRRDDVALAPPAELDRLGQPLELLGVTRELDGGQVRGQRVHERRRQRIAGLVRVPGDKDRDPDPEQQHDERRELPVEHPVRHERGKGAGRSFHALEATRHRLVAGRAQYRSGEWYDGPSARHGRRPSG